MRVRPAVGSRRGASLRPTPSEIVPLDLDYYDRGATWQDFALTIAGSNIGTLVNFGAIPPDQLGNTIRDHIGPNSSGAPWIHAITDWMELPLEGNR